MNTTHPRYGSRSQRPLPRHARGNRGFTLVEVTIILLVLVILSTTMLPQLGNYNRLARFTKMREDLTALCTASKAMLDGVWMSAFYDDPAGDSWDASPAFPVGLLVGPGDIPIEGALPNGDAAHNITGDGWYEDDTIFWPCIEITPDAGGPDVLFSCDTINYHLIFNSPHLGFPYPNVLDDPRPVGYTGRDVIGTFHGWTGPYVDEVSADPWGNRYMINTFALYGSEGGFNSPVICYSAGPDGAVDTAFNQPAGTAFAIGGDDGGLVLSAGGSF